MQTGGFPCLPGWPHRLVHTGGEAYCPTQSASGLTLVPRRPSGGTPCRGAAAAQPARARQPPAVGIDVCPGSGPSLHMAVTAGPRRWCCEAPGAEALLTGMMHQWHITCHMQPNVLPWCMCHAFDSMCQQPPGKRWLVPMLQQLHTGSKGSRPTAGDTIHTILSSNGGPYTNYQVCDVCSVVQPVNMGARHVRACKACTIRLAALRKSPHRCMLPLRR